MKSLPSGFAALGRWAQFILVRLVPSTTKPGRTEKVPFDWRTGTNANAHDPAIWLSADAAIVQLSMWGDAVVPGDVGVCLGFVLTRNASIWCLDLDHCIRDGKWTPVAEQVMRSLHGAAVEVSQSGEGIHIWGTGSAPTHTMKCAALGMEFYTEARFIALTGNVLAGYASTVHDAAIAHLVATCFPPREVVTAEVGDGPCAEWRGPADDEVLIARMLRSTSAASAFGARASFADLWTANVPKLSAVYPDGGDRAFDASQADAALAQHLAFWTGKDAARIERLMRRSALAREKWDSHPTYLVHFTINNACRMQREVLQDAEAPEGAAAAPVGDPWDALRDLPMADIERQWLGVARGLAKEQADTLIAAVAARLNVSSVTLRGQLRAVHQVAITEQSRAEVVRAAGERVLIPYQPDAPHHMAQMIEQAIVAGTSPGEYVRFGNRPAQIVVERKLLIAGSTVQTEQARVEFFNDADMLKLAARHSMVFKNKKGGVQEPIEHPKNCLGILLNQSAGGLAPEIAGTLTHPSVTPQGRLLNIPGLDAETGLFLTAGAAQHCFAYTREQAIWALQDIAARLLSGWVFASELDRHMVFYGLMTQFVRRLLPQAPGFAVIANSPTSGKTTLCRVIYASVEGHDLIISGASARDSDEADKAYQADMMRNPAAICIDNVPGGMNFRSPLLSKVMTTGSITMRVLGKSEMTEKPTNFAIYITGNNISFAVDEESRWLPCNLSARSGGGPSDPLAVAVSHRAAICQHLAGIILGYQAWGSGMRFGPATRFSAWDDLVRWPLMWAGAADAAHAFASNTKRGDEHQAAGTLLLALAAQFGSVPFTTGSLGRMMATEKSRVSVEQITDCLSLLGASDMRNLRLVGHRLSELVGRPHAGHVLQRVSGSAMFVVSPVALPMAA